MIEKLCMPALIYLIYSTSHVVIDTYKGQYNMAFVNVWQAILFTFLLNALCQHGLSLVSWLLVSIPFILMTVIASVLLLVFGLNPATGKAVSTMQPAATPPSKYAVPITVESPPAPAPTNCATSAAPTTTAPTTTETSTAAPTAAPINCAATTATTTVEAMTPFHGVLGKSQRPMQSNTI